MGRRKRPREHELRVKTLIAMEIAPALVQGEAVHARRLYRLGQSLELREAIETLAGRDLKIFGFEDLDFIGSGPGWGRVVAGHVRNETLAKECILITFYQDEPAEQALLRRGQEANWRIC